MFDVAEYILASHGEMTAMKLHKLCYYAQAWHLAWDGAALFEEESQAWANGPVVPALFEAHRGVFRVGPGFFVEALKDADVQHRVAERLAEQQRRARSGWASVTPPPQDFSRSGSSPKRPAFIAR